MKNPQVVQAVAGDGRNVCVQTRTGASNQIWALRAVQVTCREHAWDEGKTTKAAACQEPGERTFACIVCGETKTEEIAPLGHDYVLTEEQPAAVGKEGWKLYVCSRCGDEQKKAVPALEPDRLPGDVNGDGAVDGRDVLRLMKYFAGQDVTINEANADVTGDGAVDGRDVLRLMKYFAGQDVALI